MKFFSIVTLLVAMRDQLLVAISNPSSTSNGTTAAFAHEYFLVGAKSGSSFTLTYGAIPAKPQHTLKFQARYEYLVEATGYSMEAVPFGVKFDQLPNLMKYTKTWVGNTYQNVKILDKMPTSDVITAKPLATTSLRDRAIGETDDLTIVVEPK